MNKYFKEVVTLKSLGFKLGNESNHQLFERALQSNNPEDIELKARVKNVCTPIPLDMDKRLEEMLGVLGISKARFLYLAIASAMEEAEMLMDEIDIDEYFFEEAKELNEVVS